MIKNQTRKTMVKTLAILLTAVLSVTCLSLTVGVKKAAAATVYPSYSADIYSENIVRPFWKSNIIYNEVCIPFGRWDNTSEYGYGTPCALTKFKPIKILSVKDHTLKKTYVEGVDYVVDYANHKLTFPSGSTIGSIDSRVTVYNSDTDTYVQQINNSYGKIYGGSFTYHAESPAWDPKDGAGSAYTGNYTGMLGITYNEAMLFPQTYLYVTYVYDTSELPSASSGVFNTFDANALTNFRNVLTGNKQDINILAIGDSISAGCNATGGLSGHVWPMAEPYQPPYQQLVANEISARSGKSVTIEYASRGGTTSAWPLGTVELGVNGADVFNAALNKATYDLCIIGYGMNDAGSFMRSASSYKNNIQNICNAVLNRNPNCNIILLNSFPRNPVASRYIHATCEDLLRTQYATALLEIQQSLGINRCKMINLHTTGDFYMGANAFSSHVYNKKYIEISASNMNHPNDFFHRMYAMQILSAVYNYEYKSYATMFANKVTFNSNQGSAVAPQSVDFGSAVVKPVNPTKSGYNFAGWFTNSALTTEYNFNSPVTSGLTLYAKWTEQTASGGSSGGDNIGGNTGGNTGNTGGSTAGSGGNTGNAGGGSTSNGGGNVSSGESCSLSISAVGLLPTLLIAVGAVVVKNKKKK